MKKLLSIVIIAFISVLLTCCQFDIVEPDEPGSSDDKIDRILSSMSVREKVSQMIMLSCRKQNGSNFTQMTSEISQLLEEYQFAGMIYFAQNTVNNKQILKLSKDIQFTNWSYGHPGLFIAIDQEGGRVTRLEEGTNTPGNMALGATYSIRDVKNIASIIGSELNALGINMYFAPVADIINNPINPVIGRRSFSDDPVIVSRMTSAYLKGLNEYGIIGSLKHFPGHGDTATDSHTGLPCINKTLDELKSFELVPYIKNIDDIEMIMSAHIVFPEIEKGTYKSKQTGENINIPATLSKTIITDLLRDELGYQGVVITDALEMAAIADHFDRLDVARLAINAGVDILLMPVDITTYLGIEDLKKYISDIEALIDEGQIDINLVDAAVKRILKLKVYHGLINYDGNEEREEISIVGCEDHHLMEWSVATQAITLLKNENALPIANTDKTLIVASSDYNAAIKYGLDYAEGNADIMTVDDVFFKQDVVFNDYDKVIFLSQMNGTSYLSDTTANRIASMIDKLKSLNKKSIILSVNLPYDAARFKNADAIVLCYNPKGMPEVLETEDGQTLQYGPNIPASISMMFSDSTYRGRLPINIYDIDSNYRFTSSIIYERGFGLKN